DRALVPGALHHTRKLHPVCMRLSPLNRSHVLIRYGAEGRGTAADTRGRSPGSRSADRGGGSLLVSRRPARLVDQGAANPGRCATLLGHQNESAAQQRSTASRQRRTSSRPRMSARGPIEVQLAKAQDSVPPKSALVGGTIWELKYDGYRAPLRVTGQGAELWSRNGSNLSSHFPDLVAAAEAQLAAGVVLDGEAVVWLDGRLNFDQLQRRMVSRPAVAAKLAREHPASYVAFDLLTLGEQDLRPHPWRDRRAPPGGRGPPSPPPPPPSPHTDDYDTALEWLVDYRVAGVEGLVAKGAGSPYRPGSRDWIKVRSRENLDVIVGAVIAATSRAQAVIAGRYTDTGELVIVGRTTALSTRQAKQLA